MITKMGNVLPASAGASRQSLPYAALVSGALRTELGDTHRALKTIMVWTGVSERTAKNWFLGTVGPNGDHLIKLVRHSDAVFEAFFTQAERNQAITIRKLRATRAVVQELLAHIDRLADEA